MANIAIHKNGNQPASPAPASLAAPARWEPFRALRELMNWDPFVEMVPMANLVGAFSPSFDVKETKDGFVFKADVPGIKESDLDVNVTGNRLSISGKRDAEQHEQTDTLYTYERTHGAFTRTFTLPEGANTEAVSAELKDGVLTIQVKKTPEQQPKKIAVQASSKKS